MRSGMSAVNAWPASATARSNPWSSTNRTTQSRPNWSGAATNRSANDGRTGSADSLATCPTSVGQPSELDELEAERLHAFDDPVQLRLVADRAVEHRLPRLDVALERLEAREKRRAQAAADAELVRRCGHPRTIARGGVMARHPRG